MWSQWSDTFDVDTQYEKLRYKKHVNACKYQKTMWGCVLVFGWMFKQWSLSFFLSLTKKTKWLAIVSQHLQPNFHLIYPLFPHKHNHLHIIKFLCNSLLSKRLSLIRVINPFHSPSHHCSLNHFLSSNKLFQQLQPYHFHHNLHLTNHLHIIKLYFSHFIQWHLLLTHLHQK